MFLTEAYDCTHLAGGAEFDIEGLTMASKTSEQISREAGFTCDGGNIFRVRGDDTQQAKSWEEAAVFVEQDRKLSQAELVRQYEVNLEKVKAAHPGWKGEDYVAYAERQLAAVKARGMEGLKEVWQVSQERELKQGDDFVSHRDAWRGALVIARDHARVVPPDVDDKAYWEHEIGAFDRAFAAYASGVVPDDFHSHRSAWRNALVIARERAKVSPPDVDDKAYWEHEIRAYDRAFDGLESDEQKRKLVDERILKVLPSFSFSDMMANPSVILAVPEVEVFRGRATPDILAGVCLPDGDEEGLARLITIEFHNGRASWGLKIEHSIQKANEWTMGNLPHLCKQFEALCGVSLPTVKVIELGVGVYAAQAKYAADNPWAMANGGFYAVTDPKRGRRMFVADVCNGRTLISFVDDQLQTVTEAFEPAVVLSMADWKSLAPLATPERAKDDFPSPGI